MRPLKYDGGPGRQKETWPWERHLRRNQLNENCAEVYRRTLLGQLRNQVQRLGLVKARARRFLPSCHPYSGQYSRSIGLRKIHTGHEDLTGLDFLFQSM